MISVVDSVVLVLLLGVCSGDSSLCVWICFEFVLWVCDGELCFLVIATVGMAESVWSAGCGGVGVDVWWCGGAMERWEGDDGRWGVVLMGMCACVLPGRGVPKVPPFSGCLVADVLGPSVMGVMYSCFCWLESWWCFCESNVFCLQGWGCGGKECSVPFLLYRRGCSAVSPVCSSLHPCDPS